MSSVIGHVITLPRVGGRGVLAVYMTGGQMELHIANPKKHMSLKFSAKKIPGIKNFNPKNTRLQYLNTELFKQTDLKT